MNIEEEEVDEEVDEEEQEIPQLKVYEKDNDFNNSVPLTSLEPIIKPQRGKHGANVTRPSNINKQNKTLGPVRNRQETSPNNSPTSSSPKKKSKSLDIRQSHRDLQGPLKEE